MSFNIRALKALVAFLGVLIVAGVVTLVWVMAARLGKPAMAPPFPHAPREAASPFEFGHSLIELPKGAGMGSITSAGDFLAVEITLPNGSRQLLILDPRSGKQTGTIELHPGGMN